MALATRVAVVEDEEALGVLLRYNLEAEGYSVSVVTRGDGWSVGYGLVYLVAFVVSLLGAVLVTKIRSVR